MSKEKALEISKKLEAMTDQMIDIMKDKDFAGTFISITVNREAYVNINFENVETTKNGTDAPYVTRQTSIIER